MSATCTPKTGWLSGETYCRTHGREAGWPCQVDMRKPGESFCADCPDHEGCMQGIPCGLVKRVHVETEPTCSCPTDAAIRAAIHHSHQQLTGGNNQ